MKVNENEVSPLVTVFIPSYNHSVYVEAAVESVLAQTYPKVQLIVVDDGSTDNSAAILQGLQSRFDFELMVQKNMGLAKTLNKALFELSKGKYFAVLASDDRMRPERIEEQVKYMELHKECVLCHTDMKVIDDDNQVVGSWKAKVPKVENQFLGFYSGELGINAPSVIYRREKFIELGGYDNRFAIEDLPTWLKLSKENKFGYLAKPLTEYRRHDSNSSVQKLWLIQTVEKILEAYEEDNEECGCLLLERRLGWFKSLSKTHKPEARAYMKKCKSLFYRYKFVRAYINLLFR